MMDELDAQVRTAAFDHIQSLTQLHGDVLPWDVLRQGFTFGGSRVHLLGPQGIFRPRVLPEMPLSITTAPPSARRARPYEDQFGADGLRYKYRGTDPNHRDNVGLRKAMQRHAPLIYFHGIVQGRYIASWPAYVVADEPRELTFLIQLDDADYLAQSDLVVAEGGADARRKYVTAVARHRVHQHAFRERVLAAYRRCCTLCRLRHGELLDAAHIIPDVEEQGEPRVTNGLALCKLHHAAFDRYLIGIRPDYRIDVREDILKEIDGPMLVHGLQGFHGKRILLPRQRGQRPDPVHLEVRYERFLRAS